MLKHRTILKFIGLTLLAYLGLYGFYLLMSVGIPDKTI